MYGTVFRYRVKSGMEQQHIELFKEFDANPPEGYVMSWTYRLDKGGNGVHHSSRTHGQGSLSRECQAPRAGERFSSAFESCSLTTLNGTMARLS